MEKYLIKTMEGYPDNGKHLVCDIELPFDIRKGEDGYTYTDKKGKEHKYNIFKSETKIDDRWICHLTEQANNSLEQIFEVKAHKDLDTILKYCLDKYKKSLELELKRINNMEI